MLGQLYLFMISIIAVGPSQCIIGSDETLAVVASLTLGPISTILFILLLCIYNQCWKENMLTDMCRAVIYCCNCLALVLLLGLIVASTVWLYPYTTASQHNYAPDCRFYATPYVTMVLSYALAILICCSWVVRCCIKLKGGSKQ